MQPVSHYIPVIMQGLGTTLLLAFISLLIGAIPGTGLLIGKLSKIKPIAILCDVYIEFFESIPLLLQLFIVYYGLPLLFTPPYNISGFTAAIVVLSVNAAAHIASIGKTYSRGYEGKNKPEFVLKVLTLASMKEFANLIKYTSLLSIIAINELLRTSHMVSQTKAEWAPYILALAIYLILGLAVRIPIKVLDKVFFKEMKGV